MQALKVQVRNGRLKVDEPTDLPDGAEVGVVVIDDELTLAERAELHASLDRASNDSNADRKIDATEYLAQYRARREDREREIVEVHSVWGARRQRGPDL